MVFANEIRKVILQLADQRGPDKTFRPSEVAMLLDHKNWRKLIDQVKLVADSLIREGKIVAIQDGSEIRLSQSFRYMNIKKP